MWTLGKGKVVVEQRYLRGVVVVSTPTTTPTLLPIPLFSLHTLHTTILYILLLLLSC